MRRAGSLTSRMAVCLLVRRPVYYPGGYLRKRTQFIQTKNTRFYCTADKKEQKEEELDFTQELNDWLDKISRTPEDLYDAIREGDEPLIVDVREPEDYVAERVNGSHSIPLSILRDESVELPHLDKERPLYVHSDEEVERVVIAGKILEQKGFTVYHVTGGLYGLSTSGFLTEKGV
eukprot:TRINITY_DN4157_c0_g1_i2.p4 TRINITY_DN4157_c0_g1~~TRINITY_DN4157_c0_g1_i2.p4  ORF type:complete len:176 (+),score=24.65 TRINITY_DN4157_c0_g1_i2:2095-2622(+)